MHLWAHDPRSAQDGSTSSKKCTPDNDNDDACDSSHALSPFVFSARKTVRAKRMKRKGTMEGRWLKFWTKQMQKLIQKNWEKRQTFEKRGSEGGQSHQFWLLFRKKGNNTKRDVCLKSCLVERLWEILKSISNAISCVRLEPRKKENDSDELM